MSDLIPTKIEILETHNRIKPFIHNTPILKSSYINSLLGCEILFKCENFQKVGAFKFRGASNTVLSLTKDELKNGVATHSSGNHAAAISLAAKLMNSKAYIVMPHTAPSIKRKVVEGYGAEIIFSEPTLEDREKHLAEVVEQTGAVFIHPFNNYKVIAGQSTCAKEIYDEESNLDFILAPVGGGGLLSGTILCTKYFSPKSKVIGCEPAGADDAFRSIRDNKIYPSVKPKTIADGLLTSLGEKTFEIIKSNSTKIITVQEESIIAAMRLIWERMKIIVEPSSAVPLAVVLENQEMFAGKRIAIIISGGNVDVENLPF